MREGLKEDRYNLRMTMVEPLAARYLRVGIPERVRASGKVERPLDEAALIEHLDYLVNEGAEALAVCFLFSYLNPSHERRASEIIRQRYPDLYTSLSHEVIPRSRSSTASAPPSSTPTSARCSAATSPTWPGDSRHTPS